MPFRLTEKNACLLLIVDPQSWCWFYCHMDINHMLLKFWRNAIIYHHWICILSSCHYRNLILGTSSTYKLVPPWSPAHSYILDWFSFIFLPFRNFGNAYYLIRLLFLINVQTWISPPTTSKFYLLIVPSFFILVIVQSIFGIYENYWEVSFYLQKHEIAFKILVNYTCVYN